MSSVVRTAHDAFAALGRRACRPQRWYVALSAYFTPDAPLTVQV